MAIALFDVAFVALSCPILFGIILAWRKEWRKLVGGSPYVAAYTFGVVQAIMTVIRVHSASRMTYDDSLGLAFDPIPLLGYFCIGAGQALNVLVYYRIGIVGVYYGTAFGLNLPWVTKFPFGTIPHPQYTGVTLSALGAALLTGTYAGLLCTLITFLQYFVVIPIEQHYFGHIEREMKAQRSKAR